MDRSQETTSKAENRGKLRFVFPQGQRPLAKYKLVSKTVMVPGTIYDAALVDLSEEGACLQGSLPDRLIYELGTGAIQLGCNLYLKDNMLKVLATLRWFKVVEFKDFQFGVQFHLTEEVKHTIQRFLIRHQLDTRRLSRKGLTP